MKKIYRATGKRKTSIAQVMICNKIKTKAKVTITTSHWDKGVELHKYFPTEILVNNVLKSLDCTKSFNKFDIKIKVHGGGFNGQSDASRHAIAKALTQISEKNIFDLKKSKLLTRDSRIKERKKYGLKKARKAPQFSKR